MMVSPIVNGWFERVKAQGFPVQVREALPLFMLCFGWSMLTSYNATLGIVPRAAGLGHFSPLTMVGVYVAGRFLRFYETQIRLSGKSLAAIVVAMLVLAAMRLGFYNSPVALVLALATFMAVRKLRLEARWLQTSILFLSPSMFSVYLLHTNRAGLTWIIPNAVDQAVGFGCGKWPSYVLVALVLFVVCCIVDLARRAALHAVRRLLHEVRR